MTTVCGCSVVVGLCVAVSWVVLFVVRRGVGCRSGYSGSYGCARGKLTIRVIGVGVVSCV